MLGSRVITKSVLTLALAAPLALTSATGCGGSGKDSVAKAEVKAGEMPHDGEWTGVYYSQLYGSLHLVRDGDSIIGRWRTGAGDKWGELHGEVNGDVLRFEWKEHIIGMVGPNSTSTGHGYFKYVAPPEPENAPHEIHGEWGLGASEAGNPWEAIKQVNTAPDLDSVMPDETQRVQTKGWDQGSSAPAEDEGDDWD